MITKARAKDMLANTVDFPGVVFERIAKFTKSYARHVAICILYEHLVARWKPRGNFFHSTQEFPAAMVREGYFYGTLTSNLSHFADEIFRYLRYDCTSYLFKGKYGTLGYSRPLNLFFITHDNILYVLVIEIAVFYTKKNKNVDLARAN